ncbi:MAG: DUF58 domain-containing protein [Pirellulales bacterium]
MKLRRKTVICREGWYYLLVLAFIITGSILREVNLLLVMAGMMFFPFVFNWRAVVVGLRTVNFTRRLPRQVVAGDLLVVDLVVEKRPSRFSLRRPSSWGLVASDCIRRESNDRRRDKPLRPRLIFWRVPVGQRLRDSYRVRLNRRGRYEFGPLTVSTRFPLGLVRRTMVVDDQDTIVVLPRLGRLTKQWTNVFREAHIGTRSHQKKVGVLEGDFHSLRDWRPDDGQRWIHWRTTARRGSPVVRQFERQQNQNLLLLVDLWRPKKANAADEEAVELAASFAATVITDVCRRGNSYLHLGIAGSEIVSREGPASVGLLSEQLEMLAAAQADSTDRLPELLSRTLNTLRPEMSVVIISPRHLDTSDTEQFAELWADPGRRASIGHIVTINSGSEEIDQFFQLD